MPRLLASLFLSLLVASSAPAVTMAWSPVGNPGNPADPGLSQYNYYPRCGANYDQSCGAVPYAYSIGTYDVTNAQYAEFLNAKAASDPYGLYNSSMGDPSPSSSSFGGFGGITRSGSSGSYSFTAIAGRENMPVNNISFYDALRFANWMNNGQGSGDTETGAYTLLGGTATPSNGTTITRNAGAMIAVTSENEWYKAAYFDSATTSYFVSPARINTQMSCASPGATPNTANCSYVVNFPDGDLTPVGSYTGSASPYGTFDQGGNVFQWVELASGSTRSRRGASFSDIPSYAGSSHRFFTDATYEMNDTGFRLVLIPEPGTGLLVIAGLVGITVRRRSLTYQRYLGGDDYQGVASRRPRRRSAIAAPAPSVI